MGTLLLIFHVSSWTMSASWLREVIGVILEFFDYPISKNIDAEIPVLIINKETFYFTDNCTYFDLFAIAAPFYWIRKYSLTINFGRLFRLLAFIIFVNLIRIVLAIHLSLIGYPWYYVHELPDILLHTFVVAAVAIPAIQRDFGITKPKPQLERSSVV